eukprot:286162_1
MFSFNETDWSETETLTTSNGDQFADSIGLYNHILVVGCVYDTGEPIYVFEYNNNEWIETAKISLSVNNYVSVDAETGYRNSISIWGNSILIGAYSDDMGG